MGKIIKLTAVLFLISLYFIVVNLFSIFTPLSYENQTISIRSGGSFEAVGFSDNVSVTVLKERWYGNFLEESSTTKSTKFYLFKMFPLPWITYDFKFYWIHLVFFSLIALRIIYILFSTERRYYG